ncbi:MAG: EAL domain-containing protein [Methylococcales bacterium]|nr:EAL domain-containing protein [Methylococcales bacterium]
MPASLRSELSKNAAFLKTKVSRQAWIGLFIAASTIFIATAIVTYLKSNTISLSGLIDAQSSNPTLWVINCFPFLFLLWGQYTNTIMAYEASAMIVDQTEALRAQTHAIESQAMHDATHDPLTGLPNRVLFYDRCKQALLIAQARGYTVAVMLLDLDHFKDINDTLGHFHGDIILQQLASRLESTVQAPNTIARMGGDEFAILMPDLDNEQGALEMAHKIHLTMETPFNADKLSLDISGSLGISLFPQHGKGVDTLIQRADVAMYSAKKSHDGFAVYHDDLDEFNPRKLSLMSELRIAIEQDGLQLYFQPKVNLADLKMIGAEALVRWEHEEHGFVPPDEFVTMAEKTRIIQPMTLWVLNKAITQCALWHEQGFPVNVAVNLSTKDLHNPQLPDVFTGLLALYDAKAEWFTLEITESGIMADPDRSLAILTRLHDMHVKLSIDDFGTGYSSLAYLKSLPVDELKIDKSFVMNMTENADDATIVKATIDLAHNLGLKVTAEGVSSPETLSLLKALGCDTAQGFTISKPLTSENITHWIEHSDWKMTALA